VSCVSATFCAASGWANVSGVEQPMSGTGPPGRWPRCRTRPLARMASSLASPA
jgi:hypothetical protein